MTEEATQAPPSSNKKSARWIVPAIAGIVGLVIGGGAVAALTVPPLITVTDEIGNLETRATDLQRELREERQGKFSAEGQARRATEELEAWKSEANERDLEMIEREKKVSEREAAVQLVEDAIAANSFGSGTHQVGVHIEPGTYRNDGSGDCYWARLRNGGGGINSIIANGLPSGPTSVTIQASDWGFESQRCGTWTKQ